jgi:hypothetical protein
MAVLLPWGVLMRRNSAAHRRVLILATICISDAGFSRFVSLFLPAPTGFLGTYLFYGGQWAPYASHVSLGLETQPDHETVPMGSLARHRCGPVGHRPLLQRDLEIDLPLMAGGLGAEHAVKPVDCA